MGYDEYGGILWIKSNKFKASLLFTLEKNLKWRCTKAPIRLLHMVGKSDEDVFKYAKSHGWHVLSGTYVKVNNNRR